MTGLLNLFQFTQLEVFSEPHEQKYGQFNYCYLIEMHLDKSLFVSCSRMGPTIGSSNCNWVLKLILSCLVLSQNHAFLGYQNLMSCCFRTVEITTFLECQKHLSMQYNKLFKVYFLSEKQILTTTTFEFFDNSKIQPTLTSVFSWFSNSTHENAKIIHQYKEFIVEHGKI